jgi:hypothetical protein
VPLRKHESANPTETRALRLQAGRSVCQPLRRSKPQSVGPDDAAIVSASRPSSLNAVTTRAVYLATPALHIPSSKMQRSCLRLWPRRCRYNVRADVPSGSGIGRPVRGSGFLGFRVVAWSLPRGAGLWASLCLTYFTHDVLHHSVRKKIPSETPPAPRFHIAALG